MAAGRLPFTVVEDGGGAERLGLVCGFLGCDVHPFNPLMSALPRLLHVRGAFAADDPLGRLIDFALAESQERRAGGECVLLRLSELMFIEVVRRYLARLPIEQRGWLAGLRDAAVGGRWRVCTNIPGTTGRSRSLRKTWASHARRWPNASPTSWATRPCSTSPGGACRWRPACSRTGTPRSRRWRSAWVTNRKRPSAAHSRKRRASLPRSGAAATQSLDANARRARSCDAGKHDDKAWARS
jgi:hypothetical protein